MKTPRTIFIVFLLAAFFNASAQEETNTIKRISINDIYVQTGFFMEQNTNASLNDFKGLAPQSTLLNNDFSDFSKSYNDYMSGSGNDMFSVMLGFRFSDKQKTTVKANPLLRIGISYYSGTYFSKNISKETYKPYDTLASTQTGDTEYVDYVTNETYNMKYTSEQLRLNASLIYRTKPAARWSLFAGIGITAGLSINTKTSISYYKSSYIDGSSYSNYSTNPYYNTTEEYINKNNVGISTYIPLGVDFRMGKKSEFFKRVHLFYELDPEINITSIPELRIYTSAVLQQSFGLRISWN